MHSSTKSALIVLTMFLAVAVGFFWYQHFYQPANFTASLNQVSRENIYIRFLDEIFNIIQQNYWDIISEAELVNIYELGAEKIVDSNIAIDSATLVSLNSAISQLMAGWSDDKKKEFTLKLADTVLANLEPFGRSRLYGQTKEKELKDMVENKNQATGQIEPTVTYKKINNSVFYIKISRFSPTTIEEFQETVDTISNENYDSLILDLRGNIGGSIDILQYLLGPFIGLDEYAYEFYQQGKYQPFKTKTGRMTSLDQFKKNIILIDEHSQSSAEVMASTLKRFNVGVLVGTKTKGWGTVERLIPLKAQLDPNEIYSVLMVHSLTVGDDKEPIESHGVAPIIDIQNKNWQKELSKYFNSPSLVNAVRRQYFPIPRLH